MNQRKEITLSKKELAKHVGNYSAPNAGKCNVAEANGLLVLAFGEKAFHLHPESPTLFFQTDRDLTFEFNDNKMIVRENGDIVEAATRIK